MWRSLVAFVLLAGSACDDGRIRARSRLLDAAGHPVAGWEVLVMTRVVHDRTRTRSDGSWEVVIPSEAELTDSLGYLVLLVPEYVPDQLAPDAIYLFPSSDFLPVDDVELPPRVLWDHRLSTTSTASGVMVTWEPLDVAGALDYSVKLGSSTWEEVVTGTSVALDPRMLQDVTQWLLVDARQSRGAPDQWDTWWATAPRTIQGWAVPLSRGAACVVLGFNPGEERRFPAGSCPMTDGDFAFPFLHCTGDCGTFPIERFVVDLGTTRTVSSATVHGAPTHRPDLVVSVSDDCVTERPFASAPASSYVLLEGSATTARCVTFNLGALPYEWLGAEWIREVGVW